MQEALLIVAICSTLLNVFFRTVPLGGVATLFGYTAIIASFLYPVFLVLWGGKMKWQELSCLMLFIFIAIVSIVTGIELLGSGTLYDMFYPLLSFIVFYCSLCFTHKKPNKININRIFGINYLFCAVYIFALISPFTNKYIEVNEWGGKVFTMGLGNPNAVACYVMFPFILLCIQLQSIKKTLSKVLHLGVIGILAYILILLKSRTVIFCCLAILAYSLFGTRIKIRKWMIRLCMLIPIVMVIVQMALANLDVNIDILEKPIATGRDGLYGPILEAFNERPFSFIFGELCRYRLGNYHNSPITIVASLGVAGFVVYWIFWSFFLRSINEQASTNTQKVALFSLLACMVHSSSETLYTMGYIPFSAFFLVFVLIAKGEIAVLNQNDSSQEGKQQE